MKYPIFILLLCLHNVVCSSADDDLNKASNERKKLDALLLSVQPDVANRTFSIDVEREIVRGAQIHSALLANDQEKVKEFMPRQGAVRSFVWWLYALGQTSFSEGTFLMSDTDDFAILSYLKDCPGVYERISTHFKGEGELHQWGYDINDLPTKTIKRTILFGKAGRDAADNNLIFIKPETWGTASWGHFIMHALQVPLCVARKVPYLQYLAGTDEDEGYQKERIPQKIWCDFVYILDQLSKSESLEASTIKKEAAARGIAYMVHALQKIDPKNNELKVKVDAFISQLEEVYDNLDKRFGNEVVICNKKSALISSEVAEKAFKEIVRNRVLEVCV